MQIPENCNFTDEHEWISKDQGGYKIGITNYAQTELGDVVFIDLPKVGAQIKKGQSCATVESVKAVSDIYAPVDGKVISVNEKLQNSPELINQSPHSDGWIALIEVSDLEQLKSLKNSSQYLNYIKQIAK